ncbi:Mu transposase C-terminal domain-containing protein [Variovorax paradoxus]|uniref:Mu transposase C-terminal domain-containing protein n=1 Tax=Variovorax paradoxus TaxID=34073 RepID=UPI003ECC99ED
MSPIERWQNALQVETIRFPVDAGELEIICSEWDNASVSHTGIDKANCVFNSPELQELRRRHPGADNLSVDIKWNKRLLRHIWVLSPDTREWLCIPNRDATTGQMSAAEVAIAKKLAQLPEETAEVVKRVSSRKARHALANELAKDKTRTKRNATKKLGLTVHPDSTTGPTSAAPASQTSAANNAGKHHAAAPAAQTDTPGASASQRASAPSPSPTAIQIPIFNVVKVAPVLLSTEDQTQ